MIEAHPHLYHLWFIAAHHLECQRATVAASAQCAFARPVAVPGYSSLVWGDPLAWSLLPPESFAVLSCRLDNVFGSLALYPAPGRARAFAVRGWRGKRLLPVRRSPSSPKSRLL